MESKPTTGNAPTYIGVYNSLYSDIVSGVYPENEYLPGEATLAEKYGVSRNTLRQALAIINEDGLIIRSQGKGTLVAPRNSRSGEDKIQNPHMSLCKESIDSVQLRYNYGPPTNIAHERLQLSNSDIILACDTVYGVGPRVVGYSFTQIPTAVFPDMGIDMHGEDAVEQLVTSRVFEHAVRWDLTFKLIFANEMEVEFLRIPEGTPTSLIEAMFFDAADRPFARCKFYFLPEDFHLEFKM